MPAVDRIVGPGNAYVTEAKRQVAGIVGIDGLAGPSELAIVADGAVDPALAALDLIAQAEHDPEARTFLITTDPTSSREVDAALDRRPAAAGRREIVDEALGHTHAWSWCATSTRRREVVNDLAPEHLLLLLAEPDAFLHDGPQRRRGVPRARGPRCRSATTASRPTTSCRPRGRPGSRPACARPTSSPCAPSSR